MKKSNKFSPEVRERAVRLVQEHRWKYPSRCTALESRPEDWLLAVCTSLGSTFLREFCRHRLTGDCDVA